MYKDGSTSEYDEHGTGKLAASQIPGVSPKDASYSEPVTWTVDGSTVAAPDTTTAITEDVTFNVEYTQKVYPAVTVKYVDEDDNSVLRTDNVTVGDDGSYTATVTIPDGYVQSEIDKATSGKVERGGADVEITVKCAKDELVDPTVTDPDPAKPGDGVADKYQVVLKRFC